MSLTCALVCIATSCSNNIEQDIEDQAAKNKMFYESLKNSPKFSLLSAGNRITRSQDDEIRAPILTPVLTPEDISFLASLNEEELEDFLETLRIRLNEEGISDIDSFCDTNFEKITELFQEEETVNFLINFAEEYLSANPGWESINELMPEGLNNEEQQIFILTATCIDNLERPILDTLVFDGRELSFYKEDRSFCMQYLSHRLAIEGINVSAQIFVALFTGGTLAPVEAIGDALNLFAIWLDYKVCEHGWKTNEK